MTTLNELATLGQSVWYDNIQRSLIEDGGLQALIDAGVVGVTSNPSIFEKAIAHSTDYDEAIQLLVETGCTTSEIYEALAIEDIKHAADLLYPVYEETDGLDGYISLEVDPTLADDTEATIAEARRLFATLGRPNVMIKVPATSAGVPAIATLIGDGININVTLLFSNDNYADVAFAYINGLEKLAAREGDVSRVASVASFFVSRVDSAVDKALSAIGNDELKGKIAIANAKIAYTIYEDIFSGDRWHDLTKRGARPQRLLWASTSTKNPAYPDTLYVDELIGPNTVNTVPPATLDAYQNHGLVEIALTVDVDEARTKIARLEELGIDLETVTTKLQEEGVAAFAKAFVSLMESVAQKRRELLANHMAMAANLGIYEPLVDHALREMHEQDIISRIWDHDHTVWKPEPTEINNRLGWLRIAEEMNANLDILSELVSAVQSAGYTNVVLLGMGGSSLAPEVFRNIFGVSANHLDLAVLDSTDPGAVSAVENSIDLNKALFIVATKSGGTAETLSFFKYFYNRVAEALGKDNAGQHFVAITDPGSNLATIADKYNFRATFLNNPNIGGRYAALSFFGLLPAALVGVDVRLLLDRALTAASNSGGGKGAPADLNIAALLGATMGELAKVGRDKVTLVTSPPLASFGDWVEQLIAESSGKDGKGILPVVGESIGTPDKYGPDRLFVYMRLSGNGTLDAQVEALKDAGFPMLQLPLNDLYDLGAQFFIWEMATAVAGYRLGIQPFDQPNVEAAKIQARKMINAYQESGTLPPAETEEATATNLQKFLDQAQSGDYVAVQAYVEPSSATDAALRTLRRYIRDQTKMAVTVGYGPRFLHSTGQLHKGDAGNGLFIQLTSTMPTDLSIPDEAGSPQSSITFGVLKTAQALGDGAALRQEGRRVIHFHLGADVATELQTLIQ
jgi:transaldolase/glucose-6-phosphate isomerase